MTFKILIQGPNILFWPSKSNFYIPSDVENRIWHSKSYFDFETEAEYCILTLKILFWRTIELAMKILFWHSKSNFDIRTEDEYNILIFKLLSIHSKWCWYITLTFKILFRHSYWGGKLYFNIQNPILTFTMRPNIVFRHWKSYFDYGIGHENRILSFKNPMLTLKLGSNIVFWHSISYFVSWLGIFPLMFW